MKEAILKDFCYKKEKILKDFFLRLEKVLSLGQKASSSSLIK